MALAFWLASCATHAHDHEWQASAAHARRSRLARRGVLPPRGVRGSADLSCPHCRLLDCKALPVRILGDLLQAFDHRLGLVRVHVAAPILSVQAKRSPHVSRCTAGRRRKGRTPAEYK